jgi:arginase
MRDRGIAVVGAASSIGIRPYEEGGAARHLDQAPAVLRELGLVETLAAEDLGDAVPPPYRDFVRRPGTVRNEPEVAEYSRSLADRVALGIEAGRFTLVLGGDCSVVLGSLLGARRSADRMGLVYIDAHADFATPEESYTGSAAGMCLAMAVGRGDSPLADLAGPAPLVRAENVVLIGRRGSNQSQTERAALRRSGILDIPEPAIQRDGIPAVTSAALEWLERADVDGVWVHVDADVLDPSVMPAVDSPVRGGPGVEELAAIVRPFVDHPSTLGLQVTIYDPGFDLQRECARRIVALLGDLLGSDSNGNRQ